MQALLLSEPPWWASAILPGSKDTPKQQHMQRPEICYAVLRP